MHKGYDRKCEGGYIQNVRKFWKKRICIWWRGITLDFSVTESTRFPASLPDPFWPRLAFPTLFVTRASWVHVDAVLRVRGRSWIAKRARTWTILAHVISPPLPTCAGTHALGDNEVWGTRISWITRVCFQWAGILVAFYVKPPTARSVGQL